MEKKQVKLYGKEKGKPREEKTQVPAVLKYEDIEALKKLQKHFGVSKIKGVIRIRRKNVGNRRNDITAVRLFHIGKF